MIVSSIRRLWQHFLDDALFRNSIYLMVTTVIMGALGFFFWIIATHLFTPDQIGVGTSLISAMTLISFVGLLGFNNTFVRFLPNSADRNNDINTGSLTVIIATVVISIGYLLLIPYISPKLSIIRHSFWYEAGFVVMVAFAAINSLTDSIFLAYRSAQYSLITDGVVMGLTKIALPFAFFGLGAYGVFASTGLAASLGMVASIIFLVAKFNFKPRFKIDTQVLKKVFTYSSANYVSNLFNVIPSLTLPIIVINYLGASASAYYFLTFMLINLLYTVASSVSQSLFAEGSHGTASLKELLKKSLRLLVIIMVPAGILLALFGPYVLHFFGSSYSAGGTNVLFILVIAAPAVAAYNLAGIILRIRHQVGSLIVTNVIYAISINGLTLLWIHNGLSWVALAWLTGNCITAVIAYIPIFYYRRLATPAPAASIETLEK